VRHGRQRTAARAAQSDLPINPAFLHQRAPWSNLAKLGAQPLRAGKLAAPGCAYATSITLAERARDARGIAAEPELEARAEAVLEIVRRLRRIG
jgi:hypothetical protein